MVGQLAISQNLTQPLSHSSPRTEGEIKRWKSLWVEIKAEIHNEFPSWAKQT